ncbi:MAG: hypothetical protein ACREX3_08535 [Gammaproteobacteria bacterium]
MHFSYVQLEHWLDIGPNATPTYDQVQARLREGARVRHQPDQGCALAHAGGTRRAGARQIRSSCSRAAVTSPM